MVITMTVQVLYNPLANNRHGEQNAQGVRALFPEDEVLFTDVTAISDLPGYFAALPADTRVVLAGGDGTLNHFANALGDNIPAVRIDYYPCGSGNDFMRDVAEHAENGLVRINDYLRTLPIVTVNGKDYRFVNGIGYGIDGYCCEVGDALQAKSDKPVNYAGIAIKGLLFHFKPSNATVTVDGVTKTYRRVWLAPTMNGRYYGGGMNVSPAQDRCGADKTVSCVVLHGSGKLKTLIVFPSIFKGEHVSHKEMVDIRAGHEITVNFDRPCALQIDGETILGVTGYTVRSAAKGAAGADAETAVASAEA